MSRNLLDRITPLAMQWSVSPRRIRPDLPISGSPQRTVFRVVFEDVHARLWLLEQIPSSHRSAKQEIADLLAHLCAGGTCPVRPYCRTTGSPRFFGRDAADNLWQLSSYVTGAALSRPCYTGDAWRGGAAARFLRTLRTAGAGARIPETRNWFSILAFIRDLTQRVTRHAPRLAGPLAPIVRHLERTFFPHHDTLPRALCHGDFHPMNTIWTGNAIAAVIDWEFFGIKPEAYDAAVMIGCLGMERPAALLDGMAPAFLGALKADSLFSDASFKSLPELMLAIRFAWLSEWLRNEDTEMIDLELTYMYLLIDNVDKIRDCWEL